MLESIRCIALRNVRYNDRNSILTVFSREHGRMSVLISAGASRGALRMRALTQPLGIFECVADLRPNREITSIRDMSTVLPPHSLNPMKGTLALFVADILSAMLRESQADSHLYQFLELSARTLTGIRAAEASNFHICFLMRLAHFMGVEPDWGTYRQGRVLDFADGVFRETAPLHGRFIPSAESAFASTLSRITFRNMHLFRFSRQQRNIILDHLISYYGIHFPGLSTLNSLAVLRATFDS